MTSWHRIMTSHLVDFCEQKWSLFHQCEHLIYRIFFVRSTIIDFYLCLIQAGNWPFLLYVFWSFVFFVCRCDGSLYIADVTAVCILESFENQQSLLMADRVLKELGKTKARDAYKVRVRSHRAKFKRKKMEEKARNIKGNFRFSFGVRIGLRVHSHWPG